MFPVTKALMMIRPAAFGYNTETAEDNDFQQPGENAQEDALREFNAFAEKLKAANLPLEIFDDTISPAKPDAVFPDNWFSTHDNGSVVLYPMCAPSRRAERREDIINMLRNKYGYRTVHDFSDYESEGKFLEGTGSIVFDHSEKIAYAALSQRTNRDVLLNVCEVLGYIPLVFTTAAREGKPVYHTNVMMALHEKLAVVCDECITDASDRRAVLRMLEVSGKKVMRLTLQQMEAFAGNMLFVKSGSNEDVVVLSESAWNALTKEQQQLLEGTARPLIAPLPVIERHGGGSARCMLAEIF